MTKPCPKCDQPLREGAKFCTSCGHRLGVEKAAPPPEAAPSAAPAPQPAAVQQAQKLSDRQTAQAGDVTCPKCGKANRTGVKFCRFCGGNLAEAQVVEVPRRSRARSVTVAFLVLVILTICVSLVGIGWGLGVDVLLFG
jgi:hypothetical protein